MAPPNGAAIERALPGPLVPSRDFLAAVARGTRTLTGRPGPAYWQQASRYALTARVFPEERRLEGTARIRYTNNAPQALERLHVELAQNLHREGVVRNEPAEVTGGVDLRRVALDGRPLAEGAEGAAARYAVEGTQLVLFLPTPLAPGASAELEIDWAFRIPQAGAGARMGYSGDDLLFLAYWYPKVAVYDDVHGWFTDPFQGTAEFYHGFGDYTLTVEAPTGWLVMATGALQNADEVLAPAVAERLRRAHAGDATVQVVGPSEFGAATRPGRDGRLPWRFSAQQVRDVAFSLTRASIWDAARTPVGDRDGDGETDYAHINTFYRPAAPRWREVTRYQQHSIAFFSQYTGLPYPWPHMTAVEGGGIIGGGMEFPMMTLMGDYNARGDSALYYVTAHELAHMWVPMIVSTNERRHSWMDEGTTTFHENQARADFFPGPRHYLDDQNTYLAVARAGLEGELLRWSDFHHPGPAFGIASYMKPASLLELLRVVLGEETFLRAHRDYLATWAYKHPTPYDFFNTFERVAGRDLDWFWRSYYDETWLLDHAVASVRQAGGTAEVVVEDRGQAFLPAWVTLTLADGQTVEREVPVETWLRGARQATLRVPVGAPVVRAEVAANPRIPDVDRTNNVWSR